MERLKNIHPGEILMEEFLLPLKKLFEFDYPPLKGGGFKPNSWLRHHNFFYCTGKA